ncbi:MAG: transcriptional regulator [Desulfurococcales archaeon]|nr:transcriptional regulator [Desulfurococcales archaeon]
MALENHVEVEFPRVPIKPVGAKEVRELEIALIIGTILRPDVFKEFLEPKEFTTWVDSLAVAAGALAREKAGYTISRIAEELGRSEATIRNHLQGKTKAGQLVRETYDMLKTGKLRIIVPIAPAEARKLEERVRELEEENKKLKDKLEKAKRTLQELLAEL